MLFQAPLDAKTIGGTTISVVTGSSVLGQERKQEVNVEKQIVLR